MVKKLIVKKIMTDEQLKELKGTKLPSNYFKTIIKEDVDVFTEDGKPLLKFRKNVLDRKIIDIAYDNMIDHAKKVSSQRGTYANKDKQKAHWKTNEPVRSNIMGYYDTLSLNLNALLRDAGVKKKHYCRQTGFTADHPDKWAKIVPLMQDIDKQYKKLFPKHHRKQYKEARKTPYFIPKTAFSTLTLNLNVQALPHTDSGDYPEGFGNLVVIEKGNYRGGYTGFPQYGVAVDVRTGDFLAMDVHQLHANTPIMGDGNHKRLSLVSYLRKGFVKKCQDEKKILPADYFVKLRKKLNKSDKNKKKSTKKKKTKRKTKRKKTKRKTKRKKTKKNNWALF